MDKFEITGNWEKIRAKLQQKYSGLTKDDLTYTVGQGEELLRKLGKKTRQSRATLIKEINSM
jgi:hypothetical protein